MNARQLLPSLGCAVFAHVALISALLHTTRTRSPADTPPQVLLVRWMSSPHRAEGAAASALAAAPAKVSSRQASLRQRSSAATSPSTQAADLPSIAPAPAPYPANSPAFQEARAEPQTAPPDTHSATAKGSAEAPAQISASSGQAGGQTGGVPGGQDLTPMYNAGYLSNPSPRYPLASRERREEGQVLLKVQVGQDGQADEVKLYRSSGFDRLDQASMEAVRHWRFVPAQQAGKTVAASVIVPINFSLRR